MIAGYERIVATDTMLGDRGIEVAVTAGSRTGPRPQAAEHDLPDRA